MDRIVDVPRRLGAPDAIVRYRAAGVRRAIAGSIRIADDPADTIERPRHFADLGSDPVVFDPQPSEQRFAAIREAIS